MGFFDFIKNAASTVISGVTGLVQHSPILQAVAPLAGIVAHAIPAVGPIIDAAVPALHAVFSNDANAEPVAKVETTPAPPPSQPPLTDLKAELDRREAEAKQNQKERDDELTRRLATDLDKRITDNFHNLEKDLTTKVKGFLDSFTVAATESKNIMISKIDQLDAKIRDTVISELKHNDFIHGHATLTGAIQYIDTHSVALAGITANSGEESFKSLFGIGASVHDSLYSWRKAIQDWIQIVKVHLTDTSWIPSREMLDLYIALVHWLLIFHKAIIVTKGMHSRGLFVSRKYQEYFDGLKDIEMEVAELRGAAADARKKLLFIMHNITAERRKRLLISQKDNADGKQTIFYLEDKWPVHAVGWISNTDMNRIAYNQGNEICSSSIDKAETAKLDEAKNMLSVSPQVVLYKETANQCLAENLKPCQAVIDSFEGYLQSWANRVPPTLKLQNADGTDILHVQGVARKTPGQTVAVPKFANNRIWYRVSYVTDKGESNPSDWSEKVDITETDTEVLLTFSEFKFEGDPFAGRKPVENKDSGDKPQYNRGYRRRVYIRYLTDPSKDDGATSIAVLKDVNEMDLTTTHLLGKPVSIPVQPVIKPDGKPVKS